MKFIVSKTRDGERVISRFLGKAEEFNSQELQLQLDKRKEYINLLKKLRIEQKELLKAIK